MEDKIKSEIRAKINSFSYRIVNLYRKLIGKKITIVEDDLIKCCQDYMSKLKDFQDGLTIELSKTMLSTWLDIDTLIPRRGGILVCNDVYLNKSTYEIILSTYMVSYYKNYYKNYGNDKMNETKVVISYKKFKKLLVRSVIDTMIREVKKNTKNRELEVKVANQRRDMEVQRLKRQQELDKQLKNENIEKLIVSQAMRVADVDRCEA